MHLTFRDLRTSFNSKLKALYDQREIDQMFFILLASMFHMDKVRYFMNELDNVTSELQDEWTQKTSLLVQGTPIQYVVGSTEFAGLNIEVESGVLIPRPETEELVHWILETDPNIESGLDIGTGSGCIAIGLSNHLPKLRMTGVDVSEAAIKIAQNNVLRLGLGDRVEILNVNISLDETINDLMNDRKKFDLIVSNPPYIGPEEKDQMKDNVLKYEPGLALFSEDPLYFYERIASISKDVLSKDGVLYFEIHESYGSMVIQILEKYGFTRTELRQDMQGKDRMIRASKI